MAGYKTVQNEYGEWILVPDTAAPKAPAATPAPTNNLDYWGYPTSVPKGSEVAGAVYKPSMNLDYWGYPVVSGFKGSEAAGSALG